MPPPKYGDKPAAASSYSPEPDYKPASSTPAPPPPEYTQAEPNKPPGHPGDAYNPDCKYEDVPFTDCDPFHLVKWRQMKLTFGGSQCESYKNETERCSTDDFPPGNIHKKHKLLLHIAHIRTIWLHGHGSTFRGRGDPKF
jgi:hypothetical protein